MNKIWVVVLLFIIIFLVYFILSPKKINKKNNYFINKVINIDSNLVQAEEHDGFFYLENQCGYFSFKQGITHYRKCDDNEYILANNFFYLIFNDLEKNIKVFSPNGNKISEIFTNGYPYIYNNSSVFYILNNDNKSFSLYSDKCEKFFDDINFTSMITSISMDKNFNTLVSTIDGKTFLFTSKGEKIFDKKFDGKSKIIITKSSMIDYEGNNIAVCSGLYPEYIEVFKTNDNNKSISYKTETNFRYNIFLLFLNNRLYFEGIDEVKYINLRNKKNGSIDVKGEISELKFDDSGNILIASQQNQIYYLTIYSSKSEKIFHKEFSNKISNFCFLDKQTLYFKYNDKILQIKVG